MLRSKWNSGGSGDHAETYSSTDSQDDVRGKPKDKMKLVYILFFIQGVGSLLPFNMFITASLYFTVKLQGTRFQHTFENYISLASSVPTIIASVITVRMLRSYRLQTRMVFSLSVLIIMFIFTTIMVKVNTSKFFGTSIYQASLFGLAGVFPKEYTQSLISGMALAGVFAALASIFSLIGISDPYDSALGYFSCAVVVLIICLITNVGLGKLEFARFYMKNLEYGKSAAPVQEETHADVEDVNDDARDLLYKQTLHANSSNYVLLIWKRVWPVGTAVFLCFTVTLSIFPAVMARIQSVDRVPNNVFTDKLFTPLCCFLLFNTSDFVGRAISVWILVPNYNRGISILLLSMSRIAFIPLILYCNAQPRSHLPVLVNSDVVYIILSCLIGLSNGYIASLCMMFGPRRVHPQYAESTGAIMNVCLVLGLGAGSALSFAVVAML
ncbi:uncharacterized protein TRIADDRAFT_61352 [Trichoplax adhaerens]|uniref:Equilibrative nucleoside transporter 1 n=1 Tax=Trichoplax adhaerens TaxID=10228 RepID=B3SAR4_TRIAD|nr:hypothetical protein TRIADDRAFT_61352 [Trichoplax adhaerens]EDV20202.1 hypothetical protein TRIADDRAFT_61352 [Trichoplax adhaerens]|eukprot:XP_002117363.1 hypothetical protein TRIADDRAFT_61352 [Trichoplax adhaerens]